MILIIDNYDSFSYNLYQIVGGFNKSVQVIKNDEMRPSEIKENLNPSHIIISPGPGRPKDAGFSEDIVEYFKDKTPILGVCLGHQAICENFGGEIVYANKIMHGKKSNIHIANGSPIFKGLAPIIEAGRYHSLVVKRNSLPDEVLVIAEDESSEVMAVKHRDYDIYGIQFHPESILTPNGNLLIENFLNMGGI